MGVPLTWLIPEWPAPPGVRAACSTRSGGASPAPFDSLNLGDHVGDAPECVAANRQAFADALGARPVFLQQVHGRDIVRIDGNTPDATRADGCIADAPGIACTIMVADCIPVLFTTRRGEVVAAAHAGWRGLAGENGQGILEAVWERLQRDRGVETADALAWLGPCIGPGAFEVGPEVKAAFEQQQPAAATSFRPHRAGKWLADLPALARQRLASLGIHAVYGNDGADPWCTASNPSRFFSHRRDGVSGRFAAAIWRT